MLELLLPVHARFNIADRRRPVSSFLPSKKTSSFSDGSRKKTSKDIIGARQTPPASRKDRIASPTRPQPAEDARGDLRGDGTRICFSHSPLPVILREL
jgi:hypothetical protein